jgi:hypothetical protein
MNEAPRTDEQVIKELARDARSLKDDRAFRAAMGLLERQWRGELMACPAEKLVEVRAKLQALEGIPQMLDHLIASEKMAQRGTNGGRR